MQGLLSDGGKQGGCSLNPSSEGTWYRRCGGSGADPGWWAMPPSSCYTQQLAFLAAPSGTYCMSKFQQGDRVKGRGLCTCQQRRKVCLRNRDLLNVQKCSAAQTPLSLAKPAQDPLDWCFQEVDQISVQQCYQKSKISREKVASKTTMTLTHSEELKSLISSNAPVYLDFTERCLQETITAETLLLCWGPSWMFFLN